MAQLVLLLADLRRSRDGHHDRLHGDDVDARRRRRRRHDERRRQRQRSSWQRDDDKKRSSRHDGDVGAVAGESPPLPLLHPLSGEGWSRVGRGVGVGYCTPIRGGVGYCTPCQVRGGVLYPLSGEGCGVG